MFSLLSAIGVPCSLAQSSDATIAQPDRNYQLLREDEDWSFLQDAALRQDSWDPIKYIPLRSADDWYISIGVLGNELPTL